MNKRNLKRRATINLKPKYPLTYAESGGESPSTKGKAGKTIVCYLCGKDGGTMVKDAKGYKHQKC